MRSGSVVITHLSQLVSTAARDWNSTRAYHEPLTNRRLCWQLYGRKIDKIGSWFCANLLRPIGPNANVSIPSSPLTILLAGHPLDQVKIFKYLGVLLSHDMSNQSAVRIGRSLASSTDNFITIHQAIKFTCSTLSLNSLVRTYLYYASAILTEICLSHGCNILGE